MRDLRIERLKRTTFFARCPPCELFEIVRHSDEVVVSAGTRVASHADRVRPFILILAGTLVVKRVGVEVDRCAAGSTWGTALLMAGRDEGHDVVALSPCELLVIGPRAFNTLLAKVPSFGAAVACHLAKHAARPDRPARVRVGNVVELRRWPIPHPA